MTDDGGRGLDGTAPSPCVRNCCLDENDICLGCYRSIAEIIGWTGAGQQERTTILLRCRQRREQRQAGMGGT